MSTFFRSPGIFVRLRLPAGILSVFGEWPSLFGVHRVQTLRSLWDATMAFIGIGPVQLLIVGLICLGPLVVAVILGVVLYNRQTPGPGNPNLVSCPDCGVGVSRQAASCPGCGRPMTSG